MENEWNPKIIKIKNRNVVFQYQITDWNLNLHVILGNKYNYVIDTGLGSLCAEPVLNFLKESPNPIRVVNTHYHWDHIWGNGSFGDCSILSHTLCRYLQTVKWDSMIEKNRQFQKGDVQLNLPNLTFDGELYFPDDKIRIFHTPGHTADSISVLDEEEHVLNMSDNIGDSMEEIIPSMEVENDTFRNTIRSYMALNVDACVSGHNTIVGKEVFQTILNELDLNGK